MLCLTALGISACTTETGTPAAGTIRPAEQMPDPSPEPVLIRQDMRTEHTMQALFMGRLHLDGNGCLRGNNGAGPIIIWHHDTFMERESGDRIRIADSATGNAVYVGEEIALSGGYRAGPVINVTEPVPEACQSQNHYFVAGRVMSEAQRQDILERQRNRPIAASPPEAKQ